MHDKEVGSENGWAEEAVALSEMKAREGSSSDSGVGMGVVYIVESQHLSSWLPFKCWRSEHGSRIAVSLLRPLLCLRLRRRASGLMPPERSRKGEFVPRRDSCM